VIKKHPKGTSGEIGGRDEEGWSGHRTQKILMKRGHDPLPRRSGGDNRNIHAKSQAFKSPAGHPLVYDRGAKGSEKGLLVSFSRASREKSGKKQRWSDQPRGEVSVRSNDNLYSC